MIAKMSNYQFSLDVVDGELAEKWAQGAYKKYLENKGFCVTIFLPETPSSRCDFIVLCQDKTKLVEVKWDKLANETGNVCFEVISRNQTSGYLTTEADVFLHVINEDEIYFYSTTPMLKWLMREFVVGNLRIADGGDNQTSKIILYPKDNFARLPFVKRLA
jgi:hypothetical protein